MNVNKTKLPATKGFTIVHCRLWNMVHGSNLNWNRCIHTEKYSPKSYVVNFHTQISSSQSEERTMVFTREKNDTSNQNRERCFFMCEKNDTSNQKPQRCVRFAPKFPPFIGACSLQRPFADIQREKFFSKCFCRIKKWKTSRKLEWNSFVCFTVDEVNCREPSKQQRKWKSRTRRKLKLCFSFY